MNAETVIALIKKTQPCESGIPGTCHKQHNQLIDFICLEVYGTLTLQVGKMNTTNCKCKPSYYRFY